MDKNVLRKRYEQLSSRNNSDLEEKFQCNKVQGGSLSILERPKQEKQTDISYEDTLMESDNETPTMDPSSFVPVTEAIHQAVIPKPACGVQGSQLAVTDPEIIKMQELQ